ncbi:acyl-CoA thioesterase [Microbacterium sp. gxy059]|uniref:acyl-CoA thioesterase n=1 Tax=Microbacterium sp. gxy059 TaxID=2957199 RepID=UPI003D99CDE9
MTRIRISLPMRWGDQDALGHLNNVTLQQLLEEARIRALWQHEDAERRLPCQVFGEGMLVDGEGPYAPLIGRQSVEYLAPVVYRQLPLDIDVWFGRLGGASADLCYEMSGIERGERVVYARGITTMVLTDGETMRPVRLPRVVRAAWEPLVEEPVALRGA